MECPMELSGGGVEVATLAVVAVTTADVLEAADPVDEPVLVVAPDEADVVGALLSEEADVAALVADAEEVTEELIVN
jgi:hypothetical protein